MKPIATHLTEYKPDRSHLNFNSRNQELRQNFVDKINSEREGTKWKNVSVVQLNTRYVGFAQLTTWELDVFFKQCAQSSSGFSKCFFGSLKV